MMGISLRKAAGAACILALSALHDQESMAKTHPIRLQVKATVEMRTEEPLTLEAFVVADSSFTAWFNTLVSYGGRLEKWEDENYDDFSIHHWIEYTIPMQGRKHPSLDEVLSREVQMASSIFEENANLTRALGRKLRIRARSFGVWHLNPSKYRIGDASTFRIRDGLYDSAALLQDLSRTYPLDKANLIIAFTALPFGSMIKDKTAMSTLSIDAGCVKNIGEQYILVGKDCFQSRIPHGTTLAHEIGHTLGARHVDWEKYAQSLMIPGSGGQTYLDPTTIASIREHVLKHHSTRPLLSPQARPLRP